MEEVSKIMIGREVNNRDDKIIIKKPLSDKSILSVKNISVIDGVNNLYDLSLDLKEGELLGIAGVEGNGQREIGEAIIGLKEVSEGIISLEGEKINHLTSSERRFKGIRYVPEDRIKKGLALNATINENIIMGYHRNKFLKDSKFTIDWDKTFSFSKNIIDSFRVEGSNDPADPVESLSGGNMQKLIIGREFVREAKLLVLSQPTVGLDFSAKDYIYRKINELKEKGSSILLISENLDELMKLSNRILVIYRGKIIKEFRVEDNYNEKEIGLYMTGAKGNGE
jgi:simple sugar transport system ATP-binding protein